MLLALWTHYATPHSLGLQKRAPIWLKESAPQHLLSKPLRKLALIKYGRLPALTVEISRLPAQRSRFPGGWPAQSAFPLVL